MTRTALILVAAGQGTRAGGDMPKQYRNIAGQPLITHTLKALIKAMNFDEIRIVVAANDRLIGPILDGLKIDAETVIGGDTRTKSVHAGLKSLADQQIDHVYIHDAARGFVTPALLRGLTEALHSHQAAVPALPLSDAIKTLEGESLDRDKLRAVQTPQAFHYDAIAKAFSELNNEQNYADDIAVAKAANLSIYFTSGDPNNFKVTFAEDFAKAERMIATQNPNSYIATGSGFDVHQFEESADNGPLWLCGVPIDCGYKLKGHSDADAGLHALTDAILGAICFGDIGDHFPPSDPQWKGASSDRFLEFAVKKTKELNGVIQHVDVTLICEKPKIKPHREAMRARIAELCDVALSRVSVKATTTEKLGFTGRGEGLAAQATATIRMEE